MTAALPSADDAVVVAVLDVVDAIPVGSVMSYGQVAKLVVRQGFGCTPRQVGRIMAWHGAAVPWHRVVTADGRLPPRVEEEARERLLAEEVPFTGAKVSQRAFVLPVLDDRAP